MADIEKLIQEINHFRPRTRSGYRDALDHGALDDVCEKEEVREIEYQQRLVEAGLLKEVKRPAARPKPSTSTSRSTSKE